MNRIFLLTILFFIAFSSQSQVFIRYYKTDSYAFIPTIPKGEKFAFVFPKEDYIRYWKVYVDTPNKVGEIIEYSQGTEKKYKVVEVEFDEGELNKVKTGELMTGTFIINEISWKINSNSIDKIRKDGGSDSYRGVQITSEEFESHNPNKNKTVIKFN